MLLISHWNVWKKIGSLFCDLSRSYTRDASSQKVTEKGPIFFFHGFQWDITRDGASLMAQTVKNPPAIWEAWVQSLGWQDPMEELMTTHSSILAWRISMNRGAWRATVHGVTKSQTWLRTKHSTAQGTSQRECVELQSLWSQWPSGIFTATVVPHQA